MADETIDIAAGLGDGAADLELVDRAVRGDRNAFESLVVEHQDRVFDFCFRMLGDREEASDIAQDVFLSVHRHLREFRRDAKLTTWLFRISRNHCLNRIKHLARRGRGRTESISDIDESRLDGSLGSAPPPDQALAQAAERKQVQDAIARLDDDQRALVALRDIEGLSYEEIAEISELPLGTVKSRLHRAREKLAELLGGLEP